MRSTAHELALYVECRLNTFEHFIEINGKLGYFIPLVTLINTPAEVPCTDTGDFRIHPGQWSEYQLRKNYTEKYCTE